MPTHQHTAVAVATYQTEGLLPEYLLWPYDSTRSRLVAVQRGPLVGDELTRNLRTKYQYMMRDQYRGDA